MAGLMIWKKSPIQHNNINISSSFLNPELLMYVNLFDVIVYHVESFSCVHLHFATASQESILVVVLYNEILIFCMNEFEVLPFHFSHTHLTHTSSYDMDVIRCWKLSGTRSRLLLWTKNLVVPFLSWRNSTKKHLGGFPMWVK